MSTKRIAIAGAGKMARIRGQAFLQTGQAEICAVTSRHVETARRSDWRMDPCSSTLDR